MIKVVQIKKDKKVIAETLIPKGTTICSFTGPLIDYQQTLTLGTKESFAFQISQVLYIYLDAPARFFNHSCEPNCGVTPGRELIALEDISAETELCWDYSTSMLEHHWTMKCKCHTASCRGIVRDFTTLRARLRKKYIDLNIVQSFILNAEIEKNK